MEAAWRNASETRSRIIRANLRLVVSVARKHLRPGLSLAELMSEGALTLMRAAEAFDVHRGHKFSTYATLALMKGFARSVPQMMSRPAGSASEQVLANVPDQRLGATGERLMQRDSLSQLLGQLDERERDVLRGRYGLGGGEAASAEQLSRTMGLPAQHIRQIERLALAKLRATAARG
jgi:RNA polymerase sigma factor (sigma-70 family)